MVLVGVPPLLLVVVLVVVLFLGGRWNGTLTILQVAYYLQMEVRLRIQPPMEVVDRVVRFDFLEKVSGYGTIRAKGAVPPHGGTGGADSSLQLFHNLIEGSVDIGTGAYQGTVAYNTPRPLVLPVQLLPVSPTITIANNPPPAMTIWYFGIHDEADGTSATDYSVNGRNYSQKHDCCQPCW